MVEQMAGLQSFTQAVKWLVVMVSNMDPNAAESDRSLESISH